ncbi:fumarylacetoacetate hydrolase family protein [Polyangium aurulentum]|uniref:fumarylacetoacetate hydrolase family protein n=1 Tax=Polyangium aurulentum TaxID=2567896 RepID=UPI0010AEBB91|nr:fumarylacetoacetate hydrolase family protein [Polyangium aurulentum]UQA62297.1 fumarylacetoacetate hydrolase family protein [Polyangium aurulentum]
MRIARVLHTSCPAPLIALERDGCLYDVAELDRFFDTPFSPDRVPGAADFHTRVVALACAGLDVLDEHLRAGERPTEARLWPSDLLWLPPCDKDRSLYVQVDLPASSSEPRYRIGNARGLVGHEAPVPFPAREDSPDVEISIAAVLGEELRHASAEEAEAAILGYALLLGWVARDEERVHGAARARDFAATLGPVLVTKEEAGAVEALRVRARAGGDWTDLPAPRAKDLAMAEAIAFVSGHVTLAPGDVIAGPHLGACGARLAYGAVMEVSADRIGKLGARPMRGPEPPSFRRR